MAGRGVNPKKTPPRGRCVPEFRSQRGRCGFAGFLAHRGAEARQSRGGLISALVFVHIAVRYELRPRTAKPLRGGLTAQQPRAAQPPCGLRSHRMRRELRPKPQGLLAQPRGLQPRRCTQRLGFVRPLVSSHAVSRHERRPRTEPRDARRPLQAGCSPQGRSFIRALVFVHIAVRYELRPRTAKPLRGGLTAQQQRAAQPPCPSSPT